MRDINPNEPEPIRKQVFNPEQCKLGLIITKFSIRINPNESKVEMIWINSDWKFGLDQSELELIQIDLDWKLVSDWFGFIRIDVSQLIGFSRIYFWPFFIKRDTKRFLDWFGMIRIGSDTDIGIVLIDSE